MTIGYYTAKSGVLNMQKGLDVVSNNIANVNTYGYKEHRPSFATLLYSNDHIHHDEAQVGHGVDMHKTDLLFEQAGFHTTGMPLDYALPNDGFFAVQDKNGETYYTRNGSFNISSNEGTWELTDIFGNKVLDYEGKVIEVPYVEDAEGAEGGDTATEGEDPYKPIDYKALKDLIGVYTFDNPFGLLAEDSNLYSQTETSGEATADSEKTLDKISSTLEFSSVNLADQFSMVIQYQRAFQFNSKIIQTHDEIQNIVNNLRK